MLIGTSSKFILWQAPEPIHWFKVPLSTTSDHQWSLLIIWFPKEKSTVIEFFLNYLDLEKYTVTAIA